MSTKQINLKRMSEILRKGTLDLTLQMIQLKFKEGRVYANMISGPRNVITILDLKNNIIDFSEHDEVILRFGDLVKILQTIDTVRKFTGQETIDIDIFDSAENPHVIFKNMYTLDGEEFEQRHKCIMCDNSTVQPFILGEDYSEFPKFAEFKIYPDMLNLFFQIAAHAARYGKIYLRLTNGTLSIDATDENNMFEDNHDCDFAHDLDGEDMVMCFDYENFIHLLNIIKAEMSKDDSKTFKIAFSWFLRNESGIIRVFSYGDNSDNEKEEYMLLNRPL